jgi:ribosome-associated protein
MSSLVFKTERRFMFHINDEISIAETELDFAFSRSSGPGGQNVNKVNSRATLRWNIEKTKAVSEELRDRIVSANRRRMTRDGALVLHSQRFRDQGRNTADCLSRLRDLILAVLIVPEVRRPTRPTHGSRQRRLAEKRTTSERKKFRRRPTDSE